jgi:hypothetical protein
MNVYLMQCRDIDKEDKESYSRSRRAQESRGKTEKTLLDPSMTKELTQCLMARLMAERRQEFLVRHDAISSSSSNSSGGENSQKGLFHNLIMAAQGRILVTHGGGAAPSSTGRI